jgi:LacI family transcriptional regulator
MRTHKRSNSTKRASIKDVAQLAGVSPSTVSRVLNRPEIVRIGLRTRVAQALDQTGYVPHGAARRLSSMQFRTIGAVVPTLSGDIFSTLVEGVEGRLGEFGFNLLQACYGRDPNKEFNLIRAMLGHGVDGLVLVGDDHLPDVYNLLDKTQTPYINTFIYKPELRHPCIGFDHERASYQIVKHLIDLGHTHLGILTGERLNNSRTLARLRGIRRCCSDRGIEVPPHRIVEGSYSIESGRELMRRLWKNDDSITAIATTGDWIAIGAVFEAQHIGLRVPEDISIVGFHDIPLASQINPPLTTVHVPIDEMGIMAADYFIKRLAGRNQADHIELATNIILRESIGRPRPSSPRTRPPATKVART